MCCCSGSTGIPACVFSERTQPAAEPSVPKPAYEPPPPGFFEEIDRGLAEIAAPNRRTLRIHDREDRHFEKAGLEPQAQRTTGLR